MRKTTSLPAQCDSFEDLGHSVTLLPVESMGLCISSKRITDLELSVAHLQKQVTLLECREFPIVPGPFQEQPQERLEKKDDVVDGGNKEPPEMQLKTDDWQVVVQKSTGAEPGQLPIGHCGVVHSLGENPLIASISRTVLFARNERTKREHGLEVRKIDDGFLVSWNPDAYTNPDDWKDGDVVTFLRIPPIDRILPLEQAIAISKTGWNKSADLMRFGQEGIVGDWWKELKVEFTLKDNGCFVGGIWVDSPPTLPYSVSIFDEGKEGWSVIQSGCQGPIELSDPVKARRWCLHWESTDFKQSQGMSTARDGFGFHAELLRRVSALECRESPVVSELILEQSQQPQERLEKKDDVVDGGNKEPFLQHSQSQQSNMGNAQPTNRTGKKATAQKLENAKKLGVLSLTEHGLESLPPQIFELVGKLRTLDLSKNMISTLAGMERFSELKTLKCDHNRLTSIESVASLKKLQTLSLSHNELGRPDSKLPAMWPVSLKQLSLAANALSNIPSTILSQQQSKLVSLDLSSNNLAILPEEIRFLTALEELNLDDNTIVGLSQALGDLKKLKILSLRNNQLTVSSTLLKKSSNPQPLPAVLFTDTALIDLNLHGNRMTNTQLNEFDGFQTFLDRRQKVKSKTLTNLDVCGLK